MYLHELWRYPVKSMAGEQLQTARIIQVQNAQGRTVTSRTYPDLLGFHATLHPQGHPLIDGRPWADPAVLSAVQKIVGGTRLVHDESPNRFDILPLLIATDGAIAAFGRDRRRLRPNIIIGGVPGLDERTWEGGQLLTTFDPDTLAHDPNVLRDIVKRFGGKLTLNSEVLRAGEIQLNQEVQLVKAAHART